MEKFAFVGRMLRDRSEKSVSGGVVACFEGQRCSLLGILKRGDLKIFVENLAASCVYDAGCGADLSIGCSCDVLLSKIHQAPVLLKECQKSDDLSFGAGRWRKW